MKYKKHLRIFIKRFLLSGFFVLIFFSATQAFASNSIVIQNPIPDMISSFRTTTLTLSASAVNAYDSYLSWFNDYRNYIEEGAGNLSQSAVNISKNIFQNSQNISQNTFKTVSTSIALVSNSITASVVGGVSSSSNLATSVSNGIAYGISSGSDLVASIGGGIVSGWNSFIASVRNSIASALNGIVNGWNSFAKGMQVGGTTMISSLKNVTVSVSDSVVSVSGSITASALNGAVDGMSSLTSIYKKYASFVLSALQVVVNIAKATAKATVSATKTFTTSALNGIANGAVFVSREISFSWNSFTGTIQFGARKLLGLGDYAPGTSTNTTVVVNNPAPINNGTSNGLRGLQGLTGPAGSLGPVGPAGPPGLQGPPGNSMDPSSFVSRTFFDGQVNVILNSMGNSARGLADLLANEVDTKLLTVSGNATVGETFTSNGQGIFTRVPTLAHAFDPAWPAEISNVADATLYINPATADLNTNLLGLAVGGTVKFLVDAEGNIYGNNLILTGSTTTGATTVASLLVLGNFSQTGANTFDTGTGAISLNGDTTIATGKNLTLTAGNILLSSGTINKLTLTPPATGATLTIADGKTLIVNNSLTLAGTDTTVMTFPTTSATIARTDAGQTFTGVNNFTSPALTTPTVVTSIVGGASFDAFNTTSTTINAFGAATTMTIGGTPTTAITHNYSTNATATGTTKTINFGTGGVAGSTTNINIGSAIGGTLTINSPTTAYGAGNITMTGSIADTTNRVTKGWFTNMEITNLPTINGGTLATALGNYGGFLTSAGATPGTYNNVTVAASGLVTSGSNVAYLTSVGTGVANELTYWSGTNTLGSLATATYPSLTELSYVKGVTSGIQSQINGKISTYGSQTAKYFLAAPNAGDGTPSFRAIVASDIPALSYAAPLSGTINEIAYFNSASTIGSLTVATYPSLTELSYVKGVTSGIQAQLNAKQASGSYATVALDNLASVAMNASLQFNNSSAYTLDIANTANTVAGKALTVSAGSTVTGGTADMAGGNLTLASGLGKGTGASSIIFQTGRTLTTGSTLQTLTTAMTILGSGNVGIGTTSPNNILSLDGSNGDQTIWMERNTLSGFAGGLAGNNLTISSGGATPGGNFISGATPGGDLILKSGISTGAGTSTIHFYTATAGVSGTSDNTPTEKMTILGSGNVGIGTTSPGTMLTVGTASTNTGNITVYGTVGTCVLGDSISGASCSSDLRLKDNITTLGSELTNIMALRPVTFTWKDTTKNQETNTGLIAQEVQSVYPTIVHTVYDDYLGIDYAALVVPAIKAIQEMNLNLEGVAGTITPIAGSATETFVTAFFNNVENKIGAWLADAGNGITNIFATTITARNELCINKTCVTEDQLKTLLTGAGGSGSGSGSGSGGSAVVTCSDGIKNQDETGIDTGGVCGTSTPTPATLQSISISTPATKLSYTVGDMLDITGLVVTGTYSDANTKVETITANDVSGFDSSKLITSQVLTITVGGKTTIYTIDVVAVAQ